MMQTHTANDNVLTRMDIEELARKVRRAGLWVCMSPAQGAQLQPRVMQFAYWLMCHAALPGHDAGARFGVAIMQDMGCHSMQSHAQRQQGLRYWTRACADVREAQWCSECEWTPALVREVQRGVFEQPAQAEPAEPAELDTSIYVLC